MFLSKQDRLKYLGFNDFWFAIIGIFILSFITDYMFNNSFGRLPILIAVLNWSIALFFSICNWTIMRSVMIGLRKKMPAFKDNFKRITIFFVLIVCTVFFVDYVGGSILYSIYGEDFNPLGRSKIILPIVLISIMTMAIYEAIYYHERLSKYIREEEQAKQAIVQVQLDTLKNQAQPHFLFNTLNTLKDIIDQNSKDEAKVFVDKLSDVYRFILESRDSNLIPFEDELKFAKSYLHIQSERFGDNLNVEWNVDTGMNKKLIVPMSLQLLLENAIKHNVISRSKPLSVLIETEKDYLIVSNKIQAKSSKLPSTGLGLKNIKTRYKLLSAKGVTVQNDDINFVVCIPLLNYQEESKKHENTYN